MGNGGLGHWPDNAETYEAFTDTLLLHLRDGTFDPAITECIHGLIERIRAYGRNEITHEQAPDACEVDTLDGYAILWCSQHPEPIPRSLDDRMAF